MVYLPTIVDSYEVKVYEKHFTFDLGADTCALEALFSQGAKGAETFSW